jgi:hypothetical protein
LSDVIKLTEKQWSQQVVDYAKLRGWLCYRTWTSIHSPAGYPDLTMVRDGVLVFAELKTEKGKVTPSQQEWLDALTRHPMVSVYLWRPSDWLEVLEALA